jgi:hypothetical protein
MHIGVESREGESLIENILKDAMHEVLEGEELDRIMDECKKK